MEKWTVSHVAPWWYVFRGTERDWDLYPVRFSTAEAAQAKADELNADEFDADEPAQDIA